ncbi:MAG: ABC transporter substrate-binding protein [Actinomycetota bacterium]|nr:ABC transporter substrate-binding protein [Actinomycetota bacterium]MDK1016626.1 ABC transporter substrate-binding protein [Actinomycetota bacterium]
MRKQYSRLLLVVVMALVAAACGNGAEETTTTAGVVAETTTTAGVVAETTTTAAVSDEIITGGGVDAEAKVINIGMLADLTGLFAPLVIDITDAQSVYWDRLNAAGGIDGWTVNLIIEDTNYDVEQHIEKYEKIRGDVVAISQSTGSPTNVAALPLYKEDSMLVMPLSWYSGWAIPEFDGGLMLEQNTNYCLEAMNILDFIDGMGGKTIAIATFPGDYGHDSAAGVRIAIEHYGMELVYDGEAAVIPGQDQTPVIQGIVASGADWTVLTTNPSIGAEILAGSVQAGYQGMFIGSVPMYNFTLLDSPVGPLFSDVFYQSAYSVGWGVDAPGNNEMRAAMSEAFPDRRPSDSFIIGWNEAITMHEVLAAAIANGDLTREGVVAAANNLTDIDFGGSAPTQSYAGTPNEFVLRSLAIMKPDLALYTAAGGFDQTLSQADGTTGSAVVKDFFVGSAAAEFEFTEPCYQL